MIIRRIIFSALLGFIMFSQLPDIWSLLGYVIICGILRAGGDTFYCMAVEASLNMLIQVPLAYISVLVLELSLPVAIAVVAISDVIKAILCYRRYLSKKWINIFTDSQIQD